MNNAVISPLDPANEPVRSYAPGTSERTQRKEALTKLRSTSIEITPIFGSQWIHTGNTFSLRTPHAHDEELATVHRTESIHAEQANDAALEARGSWAQMEWNDRAAIFLRAGACHQ